MINSDTIIILFLGSLISLFLTVVLQKPLERRWEALAVRTKANLPGRLLWLVRGSIRAAIIGSGAFLLLITVIFQFTPLSMAASGSLQRFPAYSTVAALVIWQLLVYGMFRGSIKLLRFKFRRREVLSISELEFVPATIYFPPFALTRRRKY